jgi:hypothetical protein
VTPYGLGNQVSIPDMGRNFSLPHNSTSRSVLGSSQILHNGHHGQSGRIVRLITHLHVVQRLECLKLYLHSTYAFIAWCA